MMTAFYIGALVVVLVLVAWFMRRAYRAGRESERVKGLQKSVNQWGRADEIAKDAEEARRAADNSNRADGLHDDDGFKRP